MADQASPQPPKWTGNLKEDASNLFKWAHDWYRVRVMINRTSKRVEALANVSQLTQTISNPPTKAEVENLQNKLNELIQSVQ